VATPEVVERPLRWHRSRRDHRIEGVILHAMGERIVIGNHQPIPAWEFLDRSPELTGEALSAHALIEPSGRILRCVPDNHRANHAGHSRLGPLEDLNWTFLGVEFLLEGEWDYAEFLREMRRGNVGFTDAQYESGGWLCHQWMTEHGFTRARITTHAVVSGDDVRGEGKGKVDPGIGFHQGRLTVAISQAASAGSA